MPKISIIVPVYNVEKYLSRCIDSILNQTFTDFELILVDDGSTDNSGLICDEAGKQDHRIIVIHTPNNGPGSARNIALDWVFKHSDSEWIGFIDSDDVVYASYLEILFEVAKDSNLNISVCGFLDSNDSMMTMKSGAVIEEYIVYDTEDYFCDKYTNCPWGKLFKKNLFLNVRFPNGTGVVGEDAFVTYRIVFMCKRIAYTSTKLYFYYQSPNSLMRSEWLPSKMLALSAFDEQMSFFQKNEFNKAFRKAAMCYVYGLFDNISACEKTHKYPKELAFMRKKLRKFLKRHHREFDFSISNSSHLYEKAYPFKMKIYWYLRMLKKKIIKE